MSVSPQRASFRPRWRSGETNVLSQQVRGPIVVLEQAHVSALESQRPEAAQIPFRQQSGLDRGLATSARRHFRSRTVLAADRVPFGNANAGIAVVAAVDVHPHDILARLVIVDDLGALDDAVRAEVAGRGPREQSALEGPSHQIGGGVAVDVLEGRAARLVLADQVESVVDADDAGAVGVEMIAVGLRAVAVRQAGGAARRKGGFLSRGLAYGSPGSTGDDLQACVRGCWEQQRAQHRAAEDPELAHSGVVSTSTGLLRYFWGVTGEAAAVCTAWRNIAFFKSSSTAPGQQENGIRFVDLVLPRNETGYITGHIKPARIDAGELHWRSGSPGPGGFWCTFVAPGLPSPSQADRVSATGCHHRYDHHRPGGVSGRPAHAVPFPVRLGALPCRLPGPRSSEKGPALSPSANPGKLPACLGRTAIGNGPRPTVLSELPWRAVWVWVHNFSLFFRCTPV